MAPVKTRSQPSHPHRTVHNDFPSHQQAQQSMTDYDTDLFYPSDVPTQSLPQTYSSAPSTALRSADDLNLSVLQRHNPSIESIEAIAPYAVLYTFSDSSQKWEKCNVEGSLFICKLQIDPMRPGQQRFAAIILNRRGLENFATYLETSQDVDTTDDYIILRVQGDHSVAAEALDDQGGERTKIYGLWIFSEAGTSTAGMRDHIVEVIYRCTALAESSTAASEYPDGRPAPEMYYQEPYNMQAYAASHFNGMPLSTGHHSDAISHVQAGWADPRDSAGTSIAQHNSGQVNFHSGTSNPLTWNSTAPATTSANQSRPTDDGRTTDLLGELFRSAKGH